MMKYLAALSLFFFYSFAKGQIVINELNFPHHDMVYYQSADSSSIPSTPIKLNTSTQWDFSTMKPNGGERLQFFSEGGGHPVFINLNYRSTEEVFFGKIPFTQNRYYQKDPNGLTARGYEYEQLVKNIGIHTGNTNDTIKVPQQALFSDNPYMEILFPFSYNTMWELPVKSKIHTEFSLTAPTQGLNNTPCHINSYLLNENRVISYGQCRIPAKNGPSKYFDVLLVKTFITRFDSMYIDGARAQQTILNYFGLKQGGETYTCQYRFFRTDGGMQCLAVIHFTDYTFTKIKKAEFSTEFFGVGINEPHYENTLQVYPNPANGQGEFTVKLDVDEHQPHFILTDITGKQIPVQAINHGNEEYSILPNLTLSAGVYTLQMNSENGNKVTKIIIN